MCYINFVYPVPATRFRITLKVAKVAKVLNDRLALLITARPEIKVGHMSIHEGGWGSENLGG
jgi:hypothetical protein